MKSIPFAFLLLATVLSTFTQDVHAQYQWIDYFGTTSDESDVTVAADALGNVFVTGATRGSLVGTSAGNWDVFLRKLDVDGNSIWTIQEGTNGVDISFDVTADGTGGAYITGVTKGDAFVSRYDSAGNRLWQRLLDSGLSDEALSVSADLLGSVYVSGNTVGNLGGTHFGLTDSFVAKFSEAGNLLWTKQVGTSGNDFNGGVSADGLGNVYVAGSTSGVLDGTNSGSFDAFIQKLDASGNVQWSRQFGTEEGDDIRAISADQLGNIFIGGDTGASLASPYLGTEGDAHISKFTANGDREWTRQIGTTTLDQLYTLTSDGLGNVYWAGQTRGSLFGVNAGDGDTFFGQFDSLGNLDAARQFGTAVFDLTWGLAVGRNGSVYLSGLIGPVDEDGNYDAFVAKIPEPGTYAMLSLGLLLFRGARLRRRRSAGYLFLIRSSEGRAQLASAAPTLLSTLSPPWG